MNSTKMKEKVLNYYNKHKNSINIIAVVVTVFFIFTLYFKVNSEKFYTANVAKIISVTEEESDKNYMQNEYKKQKIEAKILNGKYKDEVVEFTNNVSSSGAIDYDLKVNDEIFLRINEENTKIKSVSLEEIKRDKNLIFSIYIFVVLACIIGGMKGLKSFMSLSINAAILIMLIKFFFMGFNLIFITCVCSLIFIITSIFIVHGINKKSYSAIISTVITMLITMILFFIVVKFTNYNGLYLEELNFLICDPKIFLFAEVTIGTLGAAMDITISIAATVEELCNKNININVKSLIKSTNTLGQDIMGTMTSTLLFAYLGGSIPGIILIMMNGYSVSYVFQVYIAVETMRALVGSIGIVLSIPISRYISIMMFKKVKIGELKT